MWNNLLKISVVTYIWRRHKRTLIALPALLLYFWMVNLIHVDVITYAKLKGQTTWLAWTFLIKWLFIFIGIAIFIVIHLNAKAAEQTDVSSAVGGRKNPKTEKAVDADEIDAFAAIRAKDKLRSRADMIIDKHKKS